MADKKPAHKTCGAVWVILLVDRSVLGRNAVCCLDRDPLCTTFNPHRARQFASEKAAQKFLNSFATDIPPGYGGYPAQIVLKPKKTRRKKIKVETPFGPAKLREGETTFLDKVGTL